MKKKTTPLLLLVIMLLAAAQTKAANYDIWIGGVQLTSSLTTISNDSHPNIIKSEWTSVVYDATKNVLTIRDATIAPDNSSATTLAEKQDSKRASAIYIGSGAKNGLTIDFKSSSNGVTIDATGTNMMHGIYVDYNKTVTLVCSTAFEPVTIKANNVGIYAYNNNTVNIKNFEDLTITGGYAVSGMSNCKLNVIHSKTTFNGSTSALSDRVMMSTDNCIAWENNQGVVMNGKRYYQKGTNLGQEYYIYIGDTPITSANCDDVKSDMLKNGTITYSDYSKTLTLNAVSIVSDDKSVIPIFVNNGGPINIVLEGENALKAPSGGTALSIHDSWNNVNAKEGTFEQGKANAPMRTRPLNSQTMTTISGSGGLTVSGGGIVTNIDMKIDKTRVSVSEDLEGTGYNYPGLEIISSNVLARTIKGFESFKLTGSKIMQPSGATYNESKKAMSKTGTVDIRKYEEYSIWVAGNQVTTQNAHNVESPYLTQGTISYDANTKTLTLDNIYLETEMSEDNWRQQTGLMVHAEAVNTIRVLGMCTVISDDYIPLYLDGRGISSYYPSITIDGENQGCLYLMYGEGKQQIAGQPAICVDKVNAIIKDMAYTLLIGYENAVSGNTNTTNHQLTIKNSYVDLCSNKEIIKNIHQLTLDGTIFSVPGEAKYSSSKGLILDANGNNLSGYCQIVPSEQVQDNTYELTLIAAGIGVAWPIADYTWDFEECARTEGFLKSGYMSYNGNTNTLTLTNAEIVTDNGGVFSWSSEPFTIKVVGNCTITAGSSAVGACSDLTIVGDGPGKSSLTVVSDEDQAVWTWGSTLTVKDITLNATGKQYGLYGWGYVKLYIDNANVAAQCTDFAGAKALGNRQAKVAPIDPDSHILPLPSGILRPEESTKGIQVAAICDFEELHILNSDYPDPVNPYIYDKEKKVLVDADGYPVQSMEIVSNGIADITAEQAKLPRKVFTLQGVRRNDTQQKGVYIVNGKKVVVK